MPLPSFLHSFIFINCQDAPVKSCFAGPAVPAFHRAGKDAKDKAFALRATPQSKIAPQTLISSFSQRELPSVFGMRGYTGFTLCKIVIPGQGLCKTSLLRFCLSYEARSGEPVMNRDKCKPFARGIGGGSSAPAHSGVRHGMRCDDLHSQAAGPGSGGIQPQAGPGRDAGQ